MPRQARGSGLLLILCTMIVAAVHGEPAVDADSPAASWQALSPVEKTTLVRGIIAGSQLAMDIAQRHFRVGLAGLTAKPEWFREPLDREVYAASVRWADGEGMRKVVQRAVLSGKFEELVPQIDGFYAEPRNQRIDHAWAVWAVGKRAGDDERKWAADKLLAVRSWSNLQWLNRTKQRDRVRPTFQWDRTVGTGPFGSARRPDGEAETYYSLDPYCAAAMLRVVDEIGVENLSQNRHSQLGRPGDTEARIGSGTGSKTLRLSWHYDRWSEMQYRPMVEAYRRTFTAFFARPDAATGLVPVKVLGLFERDLAKPGTKRAHCVDAAPWAGDFAAALGDDPEALKTTAEYLDAVWRQHWVPRRGLYGVIDLETGKRLVSGVKINYYGRLGTALALLFKYTQDPKWRDRVLELNQFVWDHRRNPQRAYVPLFIDAENPDFSYNVEVQLSSKEAGVSDDSDSIYYIRDVFRQYELTGLPLLKEMVSRHGRDYIDAAWLGDEAGHFTRHWWVNVRPLSRRMYGDGRFNSNYQMALAAHLADAPQDKRYFLDLLDKQLATFRKLDSVAGLFGQQFLDGGRVEPEYGYNQDEWGISQSQEIYCDIFLSAYEAGGERRYLDEARRQMNRMLEVGPKYWNPRNAGFPAVAARLVRALGRPARVELDLGGEKSTLRLERENREVLKAEVPTRFAVLYLPKGTYTATIESGGQARQQTILAVP